MHTKKVYAAVLGISAVAFGLTFAFYQPPVSQAQTSSSSYCEPSFGGPVTQNAWCSTWSIKKWLTAANMGGPKRWSTVGSVGPSDWEVKGTLKQEGINQNFTENWRLTKAMAVAKKDTNSEAIYTWTLDRSNDEFKDSAGNLTGTAQTSFNVTGYLGNSGARWNPTHYGQIFFGSDAQSSAITSYYPQEWTVQGALE